MHQLAELSEPVLWLRRRLVRLVHTDEESDVHSSRASPPKGGPPATSRDYAPMIGLIVALSTY